MLPAKYRLKKNADFTRVLEAGQKKKFGPLLAFHFPTNEAIRVGVIVSKKVSKKAVTRNHLRRLLSHPLRDVTKETAATGDWVLLVLYEPKEPVAEFTKAVQQWQKSW